MKSLPNQVILDQRGAAPLLIMLAVVGVIAFLGITGLANFEDSIFSKLFSKPSSYAAEPGIFFVDTENKVITQTTTPTVKVQMNPPWPVNAVPSAAVAYNNDFDFVKTATAQQVTTGYKILASIDDVFESGNSFDTKSKTLSIGSGAQTGSDYVGLRLRNVNIPRGAQIKKAEVQVKSDRNQWISLYVQIAGDNAGNSTEFSFNNKPSQRNLTVNKFQHDSNIRWVKGSFYSLGDISPIIQEIVNRSDWNTNNSLSLVLRGNGTPYQRKTVNSFDSSPNNAPRVLIEYSMTGGTTPSPTPTPSPLTSPSVAPSINPSPLTSPSPTPLPVVVSATLAEDSGFTKNVATVQVQNDPEFASYTFSDSTLGGKTLFVKFKSSDGQEAVYNSSISLVSVASSPSGMSMGSDSMAMMAWRVGGKNAPNPNYDKCDDGTDVVAAHNKYYVTAYDGKNYPTWHPPVVTNPVSGAGKCYFGHEHGTDPQKYLHWDEMVAHFGKDLNGNGTIEKLVIDANGVMTPGDRAGIPFGIANEHMDQYYNQENRDSFFVRHEDHVGHKIELVNYESEMVGNTTHPMAQLPGTQGINIPFYKGTDSNTYYPTGVSCAHLHKFHQGTSSGDAIRNNLHEVIFHSDCQSVDIAGDSPNVNAPAVYPNNKVILTGMMTFGDPGGYKRFCGNNRDLLVCPDGKNPDGSCVVTDPLISKLPNAVYSDTLGRNMVDRSCLENIDSITGSFYFTPYEIWQGDFRIQTAAGKMLAEHGRQWDVLDPIRFVDPNSASGFSYNSQQCSSGKLLNRRTLLCETSTGNYGDVAWDSPQSKFKGLKRTTYFGRNRVSNSGGVTTWWTDPLGGNASTTQFTSGLKQYFSSVEADICKLSVCTTLNDRAIQRSFNSGGGSVHAPN